MLERAILLLLLPAALFTHVYSQSGSADLPCETGSVRLVGGSLQSIGIVEICFDSIWGIVCHDELDVYEATLICEQLGYLPIGAETENKCGYGLSIGSVPVQLGCLGNETRLVDCPNFGLAKRGCTGPASVKCQPCIPELDLFYCPGGTVTEPDVICIYGSHQCDGVIDCVGGDDEVCNITVGYERTVYTTTEGEGMVELCAVVTSHPGGAPRPFTISATTRDGTAVAGDDYVAVADEELVLNRGDTCFCHTIDILQDNVCESDPNEHFFLDVASASGVQHVQVNIYDNFEGECNITVGYERTVSTTTEGQGMVELCAVATSHPGGAPRAFTISATTRNGTAVAGEDYVAVSGEELMFNHGDTRQCHTIEILNDDICESDPNENFFSDLTYVSGVQPINIAPPTAEVIIDYIAEPECNITVGYERTVYTTTEGQGMIELCAVVTSHPGGAPRPFTISATTRDGTAVAGDDYVPVSSEKLVFNHGDTHVCHTIEIINDDICESDPNENFFSGLAYVSGVQPITIDPVTAEVIIDDTAEPECGITVGYERTVYTTTEGQGMVELCAVVTSHPGGAPRPFTISATTRDGTAVAGDDYVAVAGKELVFSRGDTRVCHTIEIINDDFCESDPNENFFSDLAYVTGVQPINIAPPIAEVIIDDSAEPECNITVGYERTVYTTTEGQGMVELCAVVTSHPGGAPRAFTISATTRDGTAVAGDDYVAVAGEKLVFNHGDTCVCHTLDILEDSICETDPNEYFFSDLAYVSGMQPITIFPPTAEVIHDDHMEQECNITVGYERMVYTTTEGQGMVELCAVVTSHPGGAPKAFTISATTRDGTAVAGGDYVAVAGEELVFNRGDTRVCHTIDVLGDEVFEITEYLYADLAYVSGMQPITIAPPTAQVIIDDSVVTVNDTLTGGPRMRVPILTRTDPQASYNLTSLCYEVHGAEDKFFSLISDGCTAVNAHYARANINSDNIYFKVVDAIGVRAVGDDGVCRNIRVGLSDCQATVNGVDVSGTYRMGGISVREYNGRVRIAVPNCADNSLVMWVFCINDTVEDPVTWEYFSFRMIRFVVTHGLNLNEQSHGIIGQFWNVPIDVEEYNHNFRGSPREDDYTVTVNYPGSDPRTFVGVLSNVTLNYTRFLFKHLSEFEKQPCLHAGNTQAGPINQVDYPNDSVIEGDYTEYEVESMFATDFTYSYFDNSLC